MGESNTEKEKILTMTIVRIYSDMGETQPEWNTVIIVRTYSDTGETRPEWSTVTIGSTQTREKHSLSGAL